MAMIGSEAPTKRIIPEESYGIRGIVDIDGQLYFIYDVKLEGVRRQILLDSGVMFETQVTMKQYLERKNGE